MRKMTRLSLVAGAVIAIGGGALAAVPSSAAPGGDECTLDGTATFSNPGVGAADPFTYSFDGTLSNCGSSEAMGPDAGGTIAAGELFDYNGQHYQALDTPTGTGDCATGDTQGTAVVTWDNGTYSFIQYTTKSVGAGVVLQGNVVPSVQAVNSDTGVTETLDSTRYVGDGAAGALAFEVTDPTQCVSSTGVTSAGIQGVTGIGSQS